MKAVRLRSTDFHASQGVRAMLCDISSGGVKIVTPDVRLSKSRFIVMTSSIFQAARMPRILCERVWIRRVRGGVVMGLCFVGMDIEIGLEISGVRKVR